MWHFSFSLYFGRIRATVAATLTVVEANTQRLCASTDMMHMHAMIFHSLAISLIKGACKSDADAWRLNVVRTFVQVILYYGP